MKKIKICGVTSFEVADLCCKIGAWAIGFVFVESSPRFISFTDSTKIISDLKSNVLKVGVLANPSRSDVEAALESGVDVLQFHGEESIDFVTSYLKRAKLIKAVTTENYEPWVQTAVDYLLFDTREGKSFGGTGQVFDWNLIPKELGRPFILSGGIGLENISEAMETNCYAVDLSSGVESSPGVKSVEKIHDLFNKVKNNYENRI